MIGNFGLEKTTAALLGASELRSKGSPIAIYAECDRLSLQAVGSGLNSLLQNVLELAGISDHLTEANRGQMLRLSGPLLRELLGNRGVKLGSPHPYVLVLDGLDENRSYTTVGGLVILTNSLADLHCPIVLTTRREHFTSTFTNLIPGFVDLAPKHGWKQPVRICELDPWISQDVSDYITSAIHTSKENDHGKHVGNLSTLTDLIQENKAQEYYNDLYLHPLFLVLILEDVCENGVRQVRKQLFYYPGPNLKSFEI